MIFQYTEDCMKKSLIFILTLVVVFLCLFGKLNKENHVIKSTSAVANENKESSDKQTFIEKTYDFDSNTAPISSELKAKADQISEKYGSVAVQVAVMKNNSLVYTYEYGYADAFSKTNVTADTKFRVASLAKLITDSVFMKLCDLGLASIDADISDYLGFKVRNPYYPDKVITPTMLMSHTSTILNSSSFQYSRDNGSFMTIRELIESPDCFANCEPGTYYSYSNFGVAVIGAICETLTGKHFNELAREYFFEPLNIDASYLASDLKDPSLLANLYGSEGLTVQEQMATRFNSNIGQTHHLVQGNLIISAKDYTKFLAMFSAGGVTPDGVRLLSESSIAQMKISRIYDECNLGSGFGIEENRNVFENRTLYSHTGNAYGMHSIYIIDPETGDGMTVLTSGSSVEYLDSRGIYDICYDFVKLMFPN